jgi:hypothetical protein
MRASLWWIPNDRIRALSASDLAVLRMCRALTVFLVVAAVYFAVLISGVGARAERKRLRRQVERGSKLNHNCERDQP